VCVAKPCLSMALFSERTKLRIAIFAMSICTKVSIGWTTQTLTTNAFPDVFHTNSADISLHPTQAMKRRELNELQHTAGYSSTNTFRRLITLRVILAPQ
jgi:hypothetical protein